MAQYIFEHGLSLHPFLAMAAQFSAALPSGCPRVHGWNVWFDKYFVGLSREVQIPSVISSCHPFQAGEAINKL